MTTGAAIEARRSAAIDGIEPIFSEIVRGVDERLDCAVPTGMEECCSLTGLRLWQEEILGQIDWRHCPRPPRADLLFRSGLTPCSEALSRGR